MPYVSTTSPVQCPSINRRILVVCSALWALLLAMAVAAADVVSSPADARAYRHLQLANGLKVLLISDPEAPRAAAAMDVAVGSGDDPEGRDGLAHFLEHMLFLGTQRYPDAGEYQQFISANGGSHNAFTADDHTNYFFDVDAGKLDEALDRFSQFFVAPLFTPEYVERERKAVHSEYMASIKDDTRRQYDVLRQVVSNRHPLARFSVGSLDTLADREGRPVRADLLAFYEAHYSAERMALVVLGRESLDQLQTMVAPRFSAVVKRAEVESRVADQRLFSSKYLPARVNVESAKDLRRLTLMFPLPPAERYYREKPLHYLGHLLGHEGEGSLLAVLREQGWAQSLAAGESLSGRNQGAFSITINLTAAGLEAQSKVVAMVFRYIRLLREGGVEEWRYAELQQLGEIAFRFAEKADPLHTVSRLASNLQTYRPEDVVSGDYLYTRYDEQLIREYLDYLTPDNLLWILLARDQSTNRVSDRYQAPYRFESLGVEKVRVLKSLLDELQLPAANDFIPRRLELRALPVIAAEQGEVPGLIRQDKVQEVWFQHDTRFQTPRAQVFLRIKSPAIGDSLRQAVLAELYVAMVSDALNAFAYPAGLAGLDFSLAANSRGLDLTLSGYSDKQGLLLSRIAGAMTTQQFNRARFERLQAELLRHYSNSRQQTPYAQLLEILPSVLFRPLWSDREKVAVLRELDLSDLKTFAAGFYRNSQQQMLVYGNLYQQEALKLSALVRSRLHVSDEEGPELQPAQVTHLAAPQPLPQVHVEVAHDDQAAVLYIQGAGTAETDKANMLLAQQLLSAPFFHELRTRKQLGYIVFATGMPIKEVPGTLLLVQSPAASVAQLQAEISGFLGDFAFTDADLAQNKQAVIQNLLAPAQNLAEQGSYYWADILAEVDTFDRRQRLARAVEAIEPEAFRDFFRQYFQTRVQGLWLTAAAPAKGVAATPVSAWRAVGGEHPPYSFP